MFHQYFYVTCAQRLMQSSILSDSNNFQYFTIFSISTSFESYNIFNNFQFLPVLIIIGDYIAILRISNLFCL